MSAIQSFWILQSFETNTTFERMTHFFSSKFEFQCNKLTHSLNLFNRLLPSAFGQFDLNI